MCGFASYQTIHGGSADLNTLRSLLELQAIDQDLMERRRRHADITADLKAKSIRLQRTRKQCEGAKKAQVAAEVALKRLELERASENQTRIDLEDKRYKGEHVTSARDVVRMDEQIQELNNRIASFNDRITPLRERANEVRQAHEELSVKLSEMEEDWERQKAAGIEEQERISQEYNEVLKTKKQAASKIPEHILSEYKRLLKSNQGKAVATVKRDVCSGCSERISMGELASLRRATDPILCHCGRYLITLDAG